MRTLRVAIWLLAGCGRLGFGDRPMPDPPADSSVDAPADVRPDLPGLLVRFAMEDDPTDGTLDDTGGAGRNARCVAGVNCPTQVTGHRGNAVAFGGNGVARIAYDTWLATPNGYSIVAWLYLDKQFDQVPVAKPYGSGSDDAWAIVAWGAGGAGTCMESLDGAGAREDICGPTIPALRWIHVVGRWTGQSKALFLDGVKVAERSVAPASTSDTSDMLIGADENAGSIAYPLFGRIDELELYDRGLSDAEIAELFAR